MEYSAAAFCYIACLRSTSTLNLCGMSSAISSSEWPATQVNKNKTKSTRSTTGVLVTVSTFKGATKEVVLATGEAAAHIKRLSLSALSAYSAPPPPFFN